VGLATGKLTEIYMNYLSFDCFASSLAEPDFARAARSGHYALQDYAVCSWIPNILDLRKTTGNMEVVLERCFKVWKEYLGERYIKFPNEDKIAEVSHSVEGIWGDLEKIYKLYSNYNPEDTGQIRPRSLCSTVSNKVQTTLRLSWKPSSRQDAQLRQLLRLPQVLN
jgi:hypothetical protein